MVGNHLFCDHKCFVPLVKMSEESSLNCEHSHRRRRAFFKIKSTGEQREFIQLNRPAAFIDKFLYLSYTLNCKMSLYFRLSSISC